MKTNFFAVISSAIFAFGTFANASAQNGDVAKLNVAPRTTNNESAMAANVLSSKAGSKAFKNFTKQFKNVPEADWFVTTDGGFVANYKAEAGPTRVYYNQFGRFEYSLTRYSAANVPTDIVNSVKNAFDGYRIICAEEVYVGGQNIFLVHIQSFTSSKTVRIENDEMEIIEDLLHG